MDLSRGAQAGKLTVMHLVISLNTGGLERFVINLIAANRDLCDQFLVCIEGRGALSRHCPVEVAEMNLPPGFHPSAVWRLARLARERGVQVIHTHNEKAQLYGALAGWLARLPVVHSKHGKNSTNWRSVLRNNLSAALCRKVVAVSRDAALQCVEEEKIPAEKVVTILNGVDTELFAPRGTREESKRRLGLPADLPVIGIVARLAEVKDHGTLLDACRILRNRGFRFRLLIVGDGELRGELERRAASLGIGEEALFLGMREDIPELMQAMDIFTLSSLSEGISITLLEAKACSLPVVATAVGGNPEVVVDGVTGFLVPPRQPARLAETLGRLIAARELRDAMGAEGRRRVIERFSIYETAGRYRQLYDSEGR